MGGSAVSANPSASALSTYRGQSGNVPIYIDPAGGTATQRVVRELRYPPDPATDFQRLVQAATGERLAIFGRDLFRTVPSTFAPDNQVAAPADYVIGPGDDILIRMWGPSTFNSQLTVDRSGAIYVPQVGSIHVAGLHFDDLQKQVTAAFSRTYRNFDLSINLGRLRSIQIYVVGEARQPGTYTVGSLSTLLNALFAAGGPNVRGSLRHIQLRRNGATLPEFDLYDLILKGDKSRDLRLDEGDIIFIPPVGPQVAIAGSVRHPAIYELHAVETIEDLMSVAGGFSSTATPSELSLDRIIEGKARGSATIRLDAAGRATNLRDGDVLYAGHITSGYEKSVTIRGNLANPTRFAWHEGMRLSDIIPDKMSLLSPDYWRARNSLGLPAPLFEPIPNSPSGGKGQSGSQNQPGQQNPTLGPGLVQDQDTVFTSTPGTAAAPNASQLAGQQASKLAIDQLNEQQKGSSVATPGTLSPEQRAEDSVQAVPVKNAITIPAPPINWSYAVIERLNPVTLRNSLIPFNLGKLVLDHDPSQDLPLQSGDIVTIVSQDDIAVARDEQTKYVRLEGELVASGVYSVGPEETLRDVVRRAGGITSKAYLYGSNFLRESTRVFQQQRLNEYINTLSADMERSAGVRAASTVTGFSDPTLLTVQRGLISQLRQLRATGRIVLEFEPGSTGLDNIPAIPLENGDIFRIPSKPDTVSVIGAVYGQNVFLYNSTRRLEDYVDLAGRPNRVADRKHAFVIRADGSIYSRERAKRIFVNGFDETRINPGDSIVIPEKMIKPTATRQLLDYSQILSSFGIAAAAITVLR